MPPKFLRRTIGEIKNDMSVAPTRVRATTSADTCHVDHVTCYDGVFDKLADDSMTLRPMPKPGAGDWLAERVEVGQSFTSFTKMQFRASPHGTYNTIILVTLGDGLSATLQEHLRQYIATFYQTECVVIGIPDVDTAIREGPIRTCVNAFTRQRQLFAGDAMAYVEKCATRTRALSRCAVATIGVTMEDLTKDDTWNFVYGQASLAEGRGIFSIARFSPEFNDEPVSSSEEREHVVLKRACKVVSHELGHIFGLKHCINFQCLLNGANHLGELNRQVLYECPSCTKKLQYSFGWDLQRRYTEIIALMVAYGFTGEATFLKEHVLPVVFTRHTPEAGPLPATVGALYNRSSK